MLARAALAAIARGSSFLILLLSFFFIVLVVVGTGHSGRKSGGKGDGNAQGAQDLAWLEPLLHDFLRCRLRSSLNA